MNLFPKIFIPVFFFFSFLFSQESFENQFLILLNEKRIESGNTPLTLDPLLQKLATEWSAHLAQKQKLFHRSSSFLIDFLKSHSYQFLSENLHQSPQGKDPLAVLNRWMKSPVHRKNLLEPKINRMGIFYSLGKSGDFYVVWNGGKTD